MASLAQFTDVYDLQFTDPVDSDMFYEQLDNWMNYNSDDALDELLGDI